MRILLVFLGGGTGGDAKVCLDLVSAWKSEGHSVRFAVHDILPAQTLVRKASAVGVDVELFPTFPRFAMELAKSRDSYDVLFFHTAGEIPGFKEQIWPLARAHTAPRFGAMFHGPIALPSLGLNPVKKAAVRLALKLLNSAVVPSRHKVREWQQVFGPKVNVQAVANPVHRIVPGSRSEARGRLGLPLEGTLVGFLGLFRPEKGAMDAVRATALLKDQRIHAVFAGSGPEEEACRQMASAQGDRCTFLGYLDDPSAFYNAIDAFVFPSHFESFGLTVMQAAGMGLSIAASDIPIVRDELDFPGAVFRFPPGVHKALALAIEAAVSQAEPQALAALKAHVLQLTDPRSVAQRHLDAVCLK